jgi:hypothetical protein
MIFGTPKVPVEQMDVDFNSLSCYGRQLSLRRYLVAKKLGMMLGR